MSVFEFCRSVAGECESMKPDQLRSLKRVLELSRDFHRVAKIPYKKERVDGDTVVIESGHQPLFLPYPGIWRKAFLAEFLERTVKDLERNAVALFGFLDHDFSSSKLLFQNRVPKMNKQGFLNIGLRRPDNSAIWKRFNTLPKPPEERWEKTIDEISRNYGENASGIVEELWKSYKLSENFSELNAIAFARICSSMEIRVKFFKSSDVLASGVFKEVWNEIFEKLEEFNAIQNEAAIRNGFKDLVSDEGDLPFWYHCECGGKVSLRRKENGFSGTCSLCKEEMSVSEPLTHFEKLSPKAVMRNVLFFEGLRTSIFVTGSGGSLKYGLISNEISKIFGFNVPKTVFWKSRDFYLGKEHRVAIDSVVKEFNLDGDSLADSKVILEKVESKRRQIAARMNGVSEKKVKKKFLSEYRRTEHILSAVASMFSLKPSIVDVVANVGTERILSSWNSALVESKILRSESEFYEIEADVFYDSPEALEIYEVLREVGRENQKIDPLGVFG